MSDSELNEDSELETTKSIKSTNNKTTTDNKINYSEWNGLIDRSNMRYYIHTKTATFWTVINNIFNILLIITSSVVTADGIGNIFDKNILIILGISLVSLSSINTFLEPSSKYTKHNIVSKKYRLIYHQTRRCDNFSNFLELLKLFEDTEQEAPDIPFFFSQKKIRILFMNPNLQNDFDNYYKYKNEPQTTVINTYASKMNV